MQGMFRQSLAALQKYCEEEQFKGWDPFDGLNSSVFKNLIFLNRNRYVRLFWIQAFKKNPINLRKLLGVKKDFNAKGLGLFLTGYCNLFKTTHDSSYLEKIKMLAEKIISLKTPGYSGSCWGYNFDWQSLAFFQPSYTPTIVASTFIGYALLDAFDITGNEEYRKEALSVCNFILKDLNRTYDDDGDFSFSYSPYDNTRVFNASLLGARMLSRGYYYAKNPDLLQAARKSVLYCCKFQKKDGSWTYSPLPFHQWIDSFHTGFNLECISEYQKFSGDTTFSRNLDIGLDYYINTFFESNGIPKYYNNSIYPIDVHATAQLVITLCRMNKILDYQPLVESVLSWTIRHMQSRNGYFYYQRGKWHTNKIAYIRWSQAWMFFALTEYLFSIKR